MFDYSKAYSGFSVSDIAEAKEFYHGKLGIEFEEQPLVLMVLKLKIDGSNGIFIYQKENHEPATFTVLNFPVANIEEAVNKLTSKNIAIEHYEGLTGDDGIARGIANNRGPDIAWFKDPSGNILSVLQQT